jgi:hypothetical protein
MLDCLPRFLRAVAPELSLAWCFPPFKIEQLALAKSIFGAMHCVLHLLVAGLLAAPLYAADYIPATFKWRVQSSI